MRESWPARILGRAAAGAECTWSPNLTGRRGYIHVRKLQLSLFSFSAFAESHRIFCCRSVVVISCPPPPSNPGSRSNSNVSGGLLSEIGKVCTLTVGLRALYLLSGLMSMGGLLGRLQGGRAEGIHRRDECSATLGGLINPNARFTESFVSRFSCCTALEMSSEEGESRRLSPARLSSTPRWRRLGHEAMMLSEPSPRRSRGFIVITMYITASSSPLHDLSNLDLIFFGRRRNSG